ncbi:zinc-ribbon domain containing protein [Pseudomonas anguilliseptica]|uniref:zinc-ribbon domain containing protein n=1 Tax=Pseudomonas anguilliseptica TaxID=53406 RepID=UPI00325AD770
MKIGKQRRREIKTARRLRATKAQQALIEHLPLGFSPTAAIAVNPALLASYNSYGEPLFLARGWYQDQPFRCIDCGKDEVWTAAQQRWWYEVVQGSVYANAVRCRPCRLIRRLAGRAQPTR